MSSDDNTPCVREDPHPGHFWHEEGWQPRHSGEKQHWCLGIKDPAVQAMSDDTLRLAERELQQRQDAARKLREDEKYRQRQVARGQLHLEYQGKLVELLVGASWEAPFTSIQELDDVARRDLATLWEQVCDLASDYREAEESIW